MAAGIEAVTVATHEPSVRAGPLARAPDAIRSAVRDCRSRGARDDDVLDALVALWTAGRISRGDEEPFPPQADKDRHGISMQIWA